MNIEHPDWLYQARALAWLLKCFSKGTLKHNSILRVIVKF